MIVQSVALENFRSYANQRVDLGQFTLILGPNGSGKSTILDAICFALTGTCRGTDEAGRGSTSLTRIGSKEPARVTLKTDRGIVARTVDEGPRSPAGQAIATFLKIDPKRLRLAVRPGAFLDLPETDQAGILTAAAGEGVDIHAIVKPLLDGKVREESVPHSMAELDALEKVARDRRQKLKKKLAEGGAPNTFIDPASDLAALVARPREELIGLARDARSRLENLRREAAAVQPAAVPTDQIGEIERELAGIPAVTVICPECEKPVYALPVSRGVALTPVAAVNRLRTDLQAKLAKLRKSDTKQMKLGDSAVPSLDPEAERQRRFAEAQRHVEAEIQTIDRALFVQEQSGSRGDERAKLQAEIERAEAVCKLLGPKGTVRAAIIEAEKTRQGVDIGAELNAILHAAGWGVASIITSPYRITLNGVPAPLLSRSERWRLNLAVQIALGRLSEARILVVDDGEVLDDTNRGLLSQALRYATERGLFDQFILCASKSAGSIAAAPHPFTTVRVARGADGSAAAVVI